MNKIYHLSSCSTCQRIIMELGISEPEWDMQDIKSESIEADVLDKLAKEHGSYEALFSKRAMKFRAMGLNERTLSEAEYRELILGEYTFLKRPFILIDDTSFVGNSKKVVEAALLKLRNV
ncbi:MAG: arsenate reductase [Granulosicoccus sp.]|jgi:arsenate reductase